MKWFKNKTLVTVVVALLILAFVMVYVPLLFA